jgi:hypothetical protein
VTIYITKKPRMNKSGDELARDIALERMCSFVPRTEKDVYAKALRRAEERARKAGYQLKVIDAEQALVEVAIPKTPFFTHRVKKYVRVLRESALVTSDLKLGPIAIAR